jgi:ATP-dependent helicase/nuclease subunit A
LVQDWQQRSPAKEDFKQRVTDQFRQTLTFEEVRQALSRPTGDIELWREKRFEIVMDGQWVTGAFDRVMIERDANGNAVGATILDFKSDEAEDDSSLKHIAERYRPQMLLYRKALSQILSLNREKISIQLLATQSGQVYDLSS